LAKNTEKPRRPGNQIWWEKFKNIQTWQHCPRTIRRTHSVAVAFLIDRLSERIVSLDAGRSG